MAITQGSRLRRYRRGAGTWLLRPCSPRRNAQVHIGPASWSHGSRHRSPVPPDRRMCRSLPRIIRVSTVEVERFADEIRAKPRYFGRPDGTGPKPFPSLIAWVCSCESGFRIAALHQGRVVVGLARVDDDGEVFMVVVAEARGRGVGSAPARAVLDRSRPRRRLPAPRAAVQPAQSSGRGTRRVDGLRRRRPRSRSDRSDLDLVQAA